MAEERALQIRSVNQLGPRKILVEFSDETAAIFRVDELHRLRPDRTGEKDPELVWETKKRNAA